MKKLLMLIPLMLIPLVACDSTPQPAPPGTITTVNTPDGRCHEDDSCWDCRTMGNRICGPNASIPQGTLPQGWPNKCWVEANSEMPSGYERICSP